MLDIRFIRENPDAVQKNAAAKGYKISIKELLDLDAQKTTLSAQADGLRTRRNENSAKCKSGKPTPEIIEEGKAIKDELSETETKLKDVEEKYTILIKKVPNMAAEDVPYGETEDDNKVAKVVGEPTKFDFEPKNHAEIANARGWLDKERAAKVAGSRFAYLKGDMVRLEFAIVNFVLDTLTDENKIKEIAEKAGIEGLSNKPFIPVLPPLMIRTEMYDAMDRLEPQDDRYKIEGDDLWLQGSAEHVLGSMHADEIFEEEELPRRYVGFASSFRREAGTYGKDMEGIIRMHQFDKLEMESFTTSDDGMKEHLLFVAVQEHLLSELKIPYQVIQKCTFDIGKPDARGIDMEAWLPGQNKYRETHTADYMTDYQTRRLNTRVRRQETGKLELAYTNDATAFALGRIMVAVIENYQNQDGTVTVPEALRSYLGNREKL